VKLHTLHGSAVLAGVIVLLDFVKSTRGPDFADFALRPLGFFEINPRSVIFQFGLKFEKYLQNGP
jgi:hypothetical protein